MRRGEMIQLEWSDVDFENRVIAVRAMTTKTARSRIVPISRRLLEELKALYAKKGTGEESVFGISDNVKNAFASACREAGVENFRLHDCRHTAITRMIQAGMAPMQVMKISGHTQMFTFARYVNADDDAVKRAAAAIDSFHAAG
jgi:integrase